MSIIAKNSQLTFTVHNTIVDRLIAKDLGIDPKDLQIFYIDGAGKEVHISDLIIKCSGFENFSQPQPGTTFQDK